MPEGKSSQKKNQKWALGPKGPGHLLEATAVATSCVEVGAIAARGANRLDLQVHFASDALRPHRNGAQVLQGLRVGAVDLVVLAGLDRVAGGIVPKVGEALDGDVHSAELAHARLKLRLVAVGEELSTRSVGVAEGEAEAREVGGRLGIDGDSLAAGDVGKRPGVRGVHLDEARRLQGGHVHDVAVENAEAVGLREFARRPTSHDRIVALHPLVGQARCAVKRRQDHPRLPRRPARPQAAASMQGLGAPSR
mmetsp:Transcript_139287/g.445310  ORF Transcript_139287/g.445310 Transcript_139287/m.445310 type:complete len:251 (-) Transcript_139287:55-807(-)